jgi:predicted cupin superfamily sugar epimerase
MSFAIPGRAFHQGIVVPPGFEFLEAEFAEAEDLVDLLLRHGLHFVDFGDSFGLKRG